jgi:hypothetical protein
VDEVRYVDELSAVLAELAPPCLHTLDGGINSDRCGARPCLLYSPCVHKVEHNLPCLDRMRPCLSVQSVCPHRSLRYTLQRMGCIAVMGGRHLLV